MNAGYDFYRKIPGQTVIPIDADQPLQNVFDAALVHIDPEQAYAVTQ